MPSGSGPETRITQGRLAGSLGVGKELERFCELDLKRSVLGLWRPTSGVMSTRDRKGGL